MSGDAPLRFDDEHRIAKDAAAKEMTLNAKVRLLLRAASLFCSQFSCFSCAFS
jgi:hypothetical protein